MTTPNSPLRAYDPGKMVPSWSLSKAVSTRAITIFLMLIAGSAFGQQGAPSWLEESLHSAGKMNTVVIVVAIIFLALLVWMFGLDRKLRKLEEKMGDLK